VGLIHIESEKLVLPFNHRLKMKKKERYSFTIAKAATRRFKFLGSTDP
jgi:hypothetical protein